MLSNNAIPGFELLFQVKMSWSLWCDNEIYLSHLPCSLRDVANTPSPQEMGSRYPVLEFRWDLNSPGQWGMMGEMPCGFWSWAIKRMQLWPGSLRTLALGTKLLCYVETQTSPHGEARERGTKSFRWQPTLTSRRVSKQAFRWLHSQELESYSWGPRYSHHASHYDLSEILTLSNHERQQKIIFILSH